MNFKNLLLYIKTVIKNVEREKQKNGRFNR